MFSKGSCSSISLATVTPSLVIVGEPNFLSMTTLRPLGPSVTFTAFASWFTPLRIEARPSSLYLSILAMSSFPPSVSRQFRVVAGLLLDHAEDVVLAQDQVLLVLDLDLGAAVLAEEDPVALLDVERQDRAVVLDLALAGSDHVAHDRLLLRRVG